MAEQKVVAHGGVVITDSQPSGSAVASEAAWEELAQQQDRASDSGASEDLNSQFDIKETYLREIILDLVQRVKNWTDLHVAPGQPIMVRRAANRWEQATDAQGQPIYASAHQITAFLNRVYYNTEDVVLTDGSGKVEKPAWAEELDRSHSLHPAHYIVQQDPKTGEAIYARLRLAVQRQSMGDEIVMVIRHLPDVPQDTVSLGLPLQVGELCKSPNGLIIVTGPTGAGKSTTIAGMIAEINASRASNIQTIEDPIEYVFSRHQSIINQREVGVDVQSFADGVRDALRFVPDVIVIGEIRDQATARAALRAGESGHLVIASMHAPTVFGAIRSLMALLPGEAEAIALANALIGVIAQALVPGREEREGAKFLAYELLFKVERSLREAIGARNAAELNKLEQTLAASQMSAASIPMSATLLRLVQEGKVAASVAASLCSDSARRSEILKLGQTMGR